MTGVYFTALTREYDEKPTDHSAISHAFKKVNADIKEVKPRPLSEFVVQLSKGVPHRMASWTGIQRGNRTMSNMHANMLCFDIDEGILTKEAQLAFEKQARTIFHVVQPSFSSGIEEEKKGKKKKYRYHCYLILDELITDIERLSIAYKRLSTLLSKSFGVPFDGIPPYQTIYASNKEPMVHELPPFHVEEEEHPLVEAVGKLGVLPGGTYECRIQWLKFLMGLKSGYLNGLISEKIMWDCVDLVDDGSGESRKRVLAEDPKQANMDSVLEILKQHGIETHGIFPSASKTFIDIIPDRYRLNVKEQTICKVVKNGTTETLMPIIHANVKIDALYFNVETEEMNYEVSWETKTRKPTSAISLASKWSVAHQITDFSDKGLPVTSTNASPLVDFVENYLHHHEERIESKDFIERLGFFKNDSFVLPKQTLGEYPEIEYFPSSHGDQQLSSGFQSLGTFKRWKDEIFNDIKNHPVPLLMTVASAGSVLLHSFNLKPFFLDVSSVTSKGKTIALEVAATVWGNPDLIVGSWNTTHVGIERRAALSYNLPVFLDDTKNVARESDISSLVYQLSQGQGKSRGQVVGTQRTEFWKCLFISTGEKKLNEFGNNAGQAARILAMHRTPFGDGNQIELVNHLKCASRLDYGHAGPRFIEWWFKQTPEEQSKWIQEMRDHQKKYQTDALDNTVVNRTAETMAFLRTIATMCASAWNVDMDMEVFGELWDGMLQNTPEIDKSKQALIYFVDTCVRYKRNFLCQKGDYIQEYWGDWNYKNLDPSDMFINKAKAKEILEQEGYDANTVIGEWRKRGWLKCDKKTVKGGREIVRNTYRRRWWGGGGLGISYCLNMAEVQKELDS